jgi:hypothetical protein
MSDRSTRRPSIQSSENISKGFGEKATNPQQQASAQGRSDDQELLTLPSIDRMLTSCPAELQSGPRKGQPCGGNSVGPGNDFCYRHTKTQSGIVTPTEKSSARIASKRASVGHEADIADVLHQLHSSNSPRKKQRPNEPQTWGSLKEKASLGRILFGKTDFKPPSKELGRVFSEFALYNEFALT